MVSHLFFSSEIQQMHALSKKNRHLLKNMMFLRAEELGRRQDLLQLYDPSKALRERTCSIQVPENFL